jgi:TonB family protein
MMLSLAMLLVANAPSPPPPAAPPLQQRKLRGLFDASDYPSAAIAKGEQGEVYFEVVVDPDGRVDSCNILQSSGYRDLDEVTCHIMLTRALFSPAMDDANKPIYSTYRQVINWQLDSRFSPPPIAPDWDLTINQAPDGVKLPLQFAVVYLVKADGRASHCEFSNDWAPKSQVIPPPVLVELPCRAVMGSPIRVVRNHKNEPVDASDGATVRFSVKR